MHILVSLATLFIRRITYFSLLQSGEALKYHISELKLVNADSKIKALLRGLDKKFC